MKKFKKFIAMGCAAVMAMSVMSMSAFAAYNVPENDDGISTYVTYSGAPTVIWNLSNGKFDDAMNGVSSNKGRGYSDRYYRTTSSKRCYLDVSEVDTNGETGTVTFTVKDKNNGETMRDSSGAKMIYTFTSDSNGSLESEPAKRLVFSTVSDFYFEIATSNPKTTKCYGYYTVTAY